MLEEFKQDNDVIRIPGTKNTPEVLLDPNEGIILIKGSSYAENSIDFYYGIIRWLMEYARKPAKKTEIHLCFLYLNSHAILTFMRTLQLMENLIGTSTALSFHWYYEDEDEDMLELGNDFSRALKTGMELKPLTIEEIEDFNL